MGVIIPQVITSDRASGAQVIDGSLKFDQTKKTYLTRTPGSAGNRKVWTLSYWVKLHGDVGHLFSANNDAFQFEYRSTGQLLFANTGSTSGNTTSTALFRDPDQFYHVVIQHDAVNTIARFYINGKQNFTATLSNVDGTWNNATSHNINGRSTSLDSFASFGMTNVYFIDGLALGPGYFGYTDPLTNIWKPRKRVKQGAPTANDGTVWSSSVAAGSAFRSTFPAVDAFNGVVKTSTNDCAAPNNVQDAFVEFTFGGGVPFTTLQLQCDDNASGTVVANGVDITSQLPTGSLVNTTITGISSPLTSLRLTKTTSDTSTLYLGSVTIDGIMLTDSTTTTVDFGTNGFYLPMDGSAPIGEDQSGKGNNWTPKNFGGSAALDSPAVSGARPILNTTQGGTQAGIGVFGSRENVGYAVTVGPKTGGGNAYYIDGVERPTLTGLIRGATYTFDTSDSTLGSTHPFRLSATSAHGTEYTNGVVAITGAATTITIPHNAPESLYYYCTAHSGMGSSITGITTNEKLADQYASNCTFALPLVGSDRDVSASIACTMSTSAITNSGVDFVTSYSNFYSGSADYTGATTDVLTATDDYKFKMKTGDFTVECWVYSTSTSGTQNIFQVFVGSATNYYGVYYSSTLRFQIAGSGGVEVDVGDIVMGTNKWTHIAMVRDGGTLRAFVDGVQVGSGSVTANINDSNYIVHVGRHQPSNNGFTGYMQDFRIYKGVAKYTSNFIPASTNPDILPDTPSGVSGGSKLTKITEGAVSFDGTGDFLNLASSTDFGLVEQDWTVECHAYITGTNGTGRLWYLEGSSASNIDGVYFSDTNMSMGTTGSWSVGDGTGGDYSQDKWIHVAVCHDSTNLRMYIDGVQSLTTSNNFHNSSSKKLTLMSTNNASYSGLGIGFISNFRVINGTALYTGTRFTPPSAPLTNVTNTKLLCCQSNTSAIEGAVAPDAGTGTALLNAPLSSTPFADSSSSSKAITNTGSITTASAGTNNFDITNAASFDGSSKRLNTPQTGLTFTGSFTLDTYIKLDSSAANYNIIINTGYQSGSDKYVYIGVDNNDKLYLEDVGTTGGRTTASDAISKNTWYHIRVTQGDGNMKLYANGTLQVTHTTNTFDMSSTGRNFTIGAPFDNSNNSNNFDGLIGPVRYVSSYLGPPAAGGESTSSGALSNTPDLPDLIANGDAAATNFNPFNTDINTVRGQETGYATMNPLDANSSGVLSDGNLEWTSSTTAHYSVRSTLSMRTGKWYSEATVVGNDNTVGSAAGIALKTASLSSYIGDTGGWSYHFNGNKYLNGDGGSSFGTAYGATKGNVVGFAFDADNGNLDAYLNGIYEGRVVSGLSQNDYFWAANAYSAIWGFNFGQKPFKYAPPDGFQPLNDANTRPVKVISRPDQYVGVTTYNGTGSSRDVSVGMQPDFVWLKQRNSGSNYHNLFDTVRGTTKALYSNDTLSEQPNANTLSAFNIDGFTVGTDGAVNGGSGSYVAWTWKAGGSKNTFNVDDVGYASAAAAGLTAGTITPTGASVGTKQGFSIISYSGNNTSGATFSHGLEQAPTFVMIKSRDSSFNWVVGHIDSGFNNILVLNENYKAGDTSQTGAQTQYFNDTAPSSSVVTLGNAAGTNRNTGTPETYIAYCWHDVPGLQKFGSYIGNGNADGPFVELGFRPSVIIVKISASSGDSWRIYDNQRNKFNPTNNRLLLDTAVVEGQSVPIDFLSNGFKLRDSDGAGNGSGNTYVYMAWAEAPSVDLYGGGANAR